MKKIIILIILILSFIGLVFINYFRAQQAIRDTKPSETVISLVSFPSTVKPDSFGSFVWNIFSTSKQNTTATTIFWGYDATPSALTEADSPDAVNYPYHQEEYYQGIFYIPDTFNVSVHFLKPGKVFFRAYAKVGNKHLWTPEHELIVSSHYEK